MKKNVGGVDKALRIIVGIILFSRIWGYMLPKVNSSGKALFNDLKKRDRKEVI